MTHSVSNPSPLADPLQLPLHSITHVTGSSILIVAPHPDDETLGCGGAIALLHSLSCEVRVLVVSDGTRSHPNSRAYPPPRLRSLREAETLAALSQLGVETEQVTFLRLPDGALPDQTAANFDQAVAICQAYIQPILPEIIFLPYQFDPHPDHRATWELIHQSLLNLSHSARCIEYPIWDWDITQRNQLSSSLHPWRLDIASVSHLKQRAIQCYQSQISDLIHDDPQGFRLKPELLAHFTHPWELYLEKAHVT